MLRLLSDENFHGPITQGLLRRRRDLDLVRVKDTGLSGVPDPDVLAWAASERRIVLTHDVRTMPPHAYHRVASGLPMPGCLS